jgi:hypothetical protein
MYWNNSDFQLEHFIAGKCHTPDEAYRILFLQREERELALGTARACAKRELAKKLKAERDLESTDPLIQLEAEASLIELDIYQGINQRAIEGAEHELGTLQRLMDRLEPLRKYAHLSVHEAAQAAQREEWFLTLVHRAENYLISGGAVPPDELATMRAHPDFNLLVERIGQITEAIRSGGYNLEATAGWCAGLLSEVADG